MMKQIQNEKPIIKGLVSFSLFVMGIIIIFTPMVVMEKLIVTKFQLALGQYLAVRTLEILYCMALFIFGAYGLYSFIRKMLNNG